MNYHHSSLLNHLHHHQLTLFCIFFGVLRVRALIVKAFLMHSFTHTCLTFLLKNMTTDVASADAWKKWSEPIMNWCTNTGDTGDLYMLKIQSICFQSCFSITLNCTGFIPKCFLLSTSFRSHLQHEWDEVLRKSPSVNKMWPKSLRCLQFPQQGFYRARAKAFLFNASWIPMG